MGRSQVLYNRVKGRGRGGRGGRGGREARGSQSTTDVSTAATAGKGRTWRNSPDTRESREDDVPTTTPLKTTGDDDLALIDAAVASQRYVMATNKDEPESLLVLAPADAELQMASTLKALSLAHQFRIPSHLMDTIRIDRDNVVESSTASVLSSLSSATVIPSSTASLRTTDRIAHHVQRQRGREQPQLAAIGSGATAGSRAGSKTSVTTPSFVSRGAVAPMDDESTEAASSVGDKIMTTRYEHLSRSDGDDSMSTRSQYPPEKSRPLSPSSTARAVVHEDSATVLDPILTTRFQRMAATMSEAESADGYSEKSLSPSLRSPRTATDPILATRSVQTATTSVRSDSSTQQQQQQQQQQLSPRGVMSTSSTARAVGGVVENASSVGTSTLGTAFTDPILTMMAASDAHSVQTAATSPTLGAPSAVLSTSSTAGAVMVENASYARDPILKTRSVQTSATSSVSLDPIFSTETPASMIGAASMSVSSSIAAPRNVLSMSTTAAVATPGEDDDMDMWLEDALKTQSFETGEAQLKEEEDDQGNLHDWLDSVI
jgi:hypothetical protein